MDHMEMFKEGRVRISTTGGDETIQFLEECEARGIMWQSGDVATCFRMVRILTSDDKTYLFSNNTSRATTGGMTYEQVSYCNALHFYPRVIEYAFCGKGNPYLIERPA